MRKKMYNRSNIKVYKSAMSASFLDRVINYFSLKYIWFNNLTSFRKTQNFVLSKQKGIVTKHLIKAFKKYRECKFLPHPIARTVHRLHYREGQGMSL